MSVFSLFALRLLKLCAICSNRMYFRAFIRTGVAPSIEHTMVLRREISTVVDVGANRGQFALASRVISDCTVIAFEPLPSAYADFVRVLSSDPKVVVHNFAIGPQEGVFPFHVSASDDSSSLLPISSKQEQFFPGTHEVASISVEVAPLRKFLTESDITGPSLLKIDVQGFELQVLQGCAELLGKFAYVYCECSFVELYNDQSLADEIVQFLSMHGFKFAGSYNSSYGKDGNCIQADLLFVRAR